MNISKAFKRGLKDYDNGLSESQNPFDSEVNPYQFISWLMGFKITTASVDHEGKEHHNPNLAIKELDKYKEYPHPFDAIKEHIKKHHE